MFDLQTMLILAVAVIAVIFAFIDLLVKADAEECPHTHFANYQSSGKQVCIDCGFTREIKKPHYPKHQR